MTTLRNAVHSIRTRRIGSLSAKYYPPHTELSLVLPRLEHLEQRVEKPSRSRLEVVSEKVDDCLLRRSCSTLGRADWRVVPWIMWDGSKTAGDQDWFLDALFAFISAERPKSVVRALVHAYVYFFDPERTSFHRVALFLKSCISTMSDRFAETWIGFNNRCELFNPRLAPSCIAQLALASSNLFESLREVGLTGDQIDGGLARASFSYAYQVVARNLTNVNDQEAIRRAIDQLLSWGTGTAEHFRYQSLFAPMATTLLESLASSNAASEVQERLVRYFVDKFGDPRLNRAKWHGISKAAFEVAMRILVRATLDDFTRVIDATADPRHWRERKPFWLKYYEIGAIEDAWVAFGPSAVSHARHLEKRYALLNNASDNAHSALILRISDLIIVEWSHNGRCRFFPRGAGAWTPDLYAARYDFKLLHYRSDHPGGFLPHMNNWQFRFAHVIYESTGIQHPQFGAGWR
jgi:hypothetical protein